jgi:hypothetical protein
MHILYVDESGDPGLFESLQPILLQREFNDDPLGIVRK